MKKTNNKGFSLVELIVVIAIMAVLMVVVAPQFLRYVERARLQKDNQAISEIANAVKIAMADENINANLTVPHTIDSTAVANTAKTITFDTSNVLEEELALVIGDEITTSSNTYRTPATAIQIVVNVDGDGVVTVQGIGFVEEVGGTASTTAAPYEF